MVRRVRLRVAASLLVLVALFDGAAAHTDPEDVAEQLERTEQQLHAARDHLEEVSAEAAAARAELEQVDAELVRLLAEQRQLDAERRQREAEYAEAQARTAAVTEELAALTVELQRITAELAARRRTFEQRVAAAYKHGGATYVGALLDTRDISELLTASYYLRAVLRHDRGVVEDVAALAADVATRRAEVDALRDRLAREERAAAEARDEVARLAEAHARVTAAVEAERQRHAELIAQLEAERASYEQLVRALEAESRALAEELRRSRWRAGAPGVGELVWPTDGEVTSGFGWRTHPIFGTRRFHAGIDIAAPTGQPVVAAAEGLVVSAGWRGGYGLAVVIDHGGGLATLYAHLSAVDVTDGEVVAQGQQVGRVGSTGWSTGPHLHYEVRVDGEPQDPMRWY